MDSNKKLKMEELYSLYESAMYAIAYSILNNVEQAEDVTHDSFEKIYTYLDDIKEADSLKTKAFVTRIVKNKAIDTYRKNKRLSRYDDSFNNVISDEIDPARIIENQLIRLNELDALDNALADMPERLRQVVVMKYGYGLKMTEIASILDKDSATIRKRMERAKKYLADRLGDMAEDIYDI